MRHTFAVVVKCILYMASSFLIQLIYLLNRQTFPSGIVREYILSPYLSIFEELSSSPQYPRFCHHNHYRLCVHRWCYRFERTFYAQYSWKAILFLSVLNTRKCLNFLYYFAIFSMFKHWITATLQVKHINIDIKYYYRYNIQAWWWSDQLSIHLCWSYGQTIASALNYSSSTARERSLITLLTIGIVWKFIDIELLYSDQRSCFPSVRLNSLLYKSF